MSGTRERELQTPDSSEVHGVRSDGAVRAWARWLPWLMAVGAFLVVATGCGQQAAPAQLVETVDPVTVNGKAVRAVPTAPVSLAAGDTVEVGAKGLARLLYPDGSRFLLIPQGSEPAQLAVTPRAADAAVVVVKLLKGVLAFLVPEKRPVKDRYELRALNTVTTIEGTSGRIVTSAARDSVALEHGKVTVTATAGAVTIVNSLQEAIYDVAAGVFKMINYDPTSAAESGFYDEDVVKKKFTY